MSILTSSKDAPVPSLSKADRDKMADDEMRCEVDEKNNKTKQNGSRPKADILDDTSDDDDSIDQIMDTDEFAKLHRQFSKQTTKDVEDERKQIFNILDELKEDMLAHKQKIKKQQEKLQKLQNDKKDTKKQEELTKKQTNVSLNKSVQKAEQTFKNVVNSNKQYFESIASFGQALEEGITVQTPDLEDPFYPAKTDDDQADGSLLGNVNYELNPDVVQEILLDHLQKEGMKETVESMKKESSSQNKKPSNQLEESQQKFKSYQDQFNELNEITTDLKQKKTDSALRWATQNQRQLQSHNGQPFIFMLHQVNYRTMLQKAVDIHFDLNYKHLCTPSVDEVNIDGQKNEEDGEKGGTENGSNVKKEEVLQSSLVDETMQGQTQGDNNSNQIDSTMNNEEKQQKREQYSQRDYDTACVQILNYIQVNLSQYLTGKCPSSAPNSPDQDNLAQIEEQNKIQKMMGALIFIPKYSEQRLKNYSQKNGGPSKHQAPPDDLSAQYFEFFNEERTEKLWEELVSRVNDLYCKVHRLSQQSSLFMTLVASSYSLPMYQFAHKKFIKTMAGKNKAAGGAFAATNLKSKEMPCEVDMGQDFSFHNIFICPVSKETSSQPMLLKCGHVISKQSMNKLSRNNPKANLRCPTCPQECTPETGISIIQY